MPSVYDWEQEDVFPRQDSIDAVAANLAWWWRTGNSEDYTEPECEASWWDGSAKIAIAAYKRGR